jgi:hypothetical protein
MPRPEVGARWPSFKYGGADVQDGVSLGEVMWGGACAQGWQEQAQVLGQEDLSASPYPGIYYPGDLRQVMQYPRDQCLCLWRGQ